MTKATVRMAFIHTTAAPLRAMLKRREQRTQRITRGARARVAFLAALAFASAAPLHLAGCTTASRPVATPARAQEPARYFDTSALDLIRLLPPPPANDSAETRAELDEMLKIQQSRSPAAAERASADAQVSIYRLADALDNPPAFTEKNLPLTQAMFRKILASELVVVGAAKNHYARPRPFVLEPQLAPVVARLPDGSYPSGHSSWVRSVAIVLADMVPERRAQIMARANEYARNRTVAGVHYPSDVEAGKLAGTAIAVALYASPRFLSDLAAARTELRQALHLPAQPDATRAAATAAAAAAH